MIFIVFDEKLDKFYSKYYQIFDAQIFFNVSARV